MSSTVLVRLDGMAACEVSSVRPLLSARLRHLMVDWRDGPLLEATVEGHGFERQGVEAR